MIEKRDKVANLRGPQGKSAFEVAVENGFVGTVEEWLAALSSGSVIDPITNLPTPKVVEALSKAILEPHEKDPTPHSAYDSIDPLIAYRLGKI